MIVSHNGKPIDSSNALNTTSSMNTVLSKDLDSVDVGKMSKGGLSAAITTIGTSAEVDCRGFNSILLHISISGGTATFGITGSHTSGGTFVDCYDGSTKLEVESVEESRCVLFRGIPDYVKVASSGTGTVSVRVQPLNM